MKEMSELWKSLNKIVIDWTDNRSQISLIPSLYGPKTLTPANNRVAGVGAI